MTPFAKALRYRRLAARETNKTIISLLHRLADDVESRARAKSGCASRSGAYRVAVGTACRARDAAGGGGQAA